LIWNQNKTVTLFAVECVIAATTNELRVSILITLRLKYRKDSMGFLMLFLFAISSRPKQQDFATLLVDGRLWSLRGMKPNEPTN